MLKKFTYLFLLSLFLFFGCNKESNVYKTVTIGTQEWMAENLNVEHYRNGDAIPQVQNADEWAKLTTGAWCYYENKTENGTTYGKLYNWYAYLFVCRSCYVLFSVNLQE